MAVIIENQEVIYVPRAYGYPHNCPLCQTTFYGRKNQVFCSMEHKIKSNNNKASERKSRMGGQNFILEWNVQTVFELILGKPTPIKVEKEKLLKAGYKLNGPSILHLTADNTIWSQIGPYFIGNDKNSSLITIMTLDDFKKL